MYYDKLSDLGIKLTKKNGSEKCKCPQCHDGRKNKTDKSLSVSITTGDYNCHNCGWKGNVRSRERNREKKDYIKPPSDVLRSIEIKEKAIGWFRSRGISEATLSKFMIFTKEEWMPQTEQKESCVCFPYLRGAELINIKFRDGKKDFKMVKDAELILYNLNSIGDRKKAIICEGEIDCMSYYESGFGQEMNIDKETGELKNPESEYAILSVPNGASRGNQHLDYLDNCSEWLLGLEEIVICTDADEAGKALKDELIRRLGVERCKTVLYPTEEVVPISGGLKRKCKDANELLQYIGAHSVKNLVFNSDFIPVEGIYYVEDIYPNLLENFRKGIQLAPTTRFGDMDNYFRWKKGEINLFVGYGNHGKSFFLLQLMLTKSIFDGWKWAIFSPENYPADDFFLDLVEMYVGKWTDNMSEKEFTGALDFLNKHFFYVYPDDSHDLHSIHEKFRYLILKKGIDGVLVDPWNQLDHLQKAYQRDDQYLSEALKDVKRFSLLNAISYNIISHPKNPSYNQDKSLPVVDMYDISGGAMWGNKVDQIVSYYRPNFHSNKSDPNVQVYIQKVKRKRTGGQHGDFPLILLWSQKRYADPISQQVFCDPQMAEFIKAKEKQNYVQPPLDEGWNETDIDF